MGAAALRHFLATFFFGFVVLLTQVSAQARAPHPSIPPPVVSEGFGVNIHFTDPQPGEMKKIAESGARWVRMDLHWDTTEREKGVYDFSAYDRLVQALDEHGLKALFILDYGHPLYDGGLAPRDEATRQAFARWAVAAAGRYAGKGYLWEVWNEPNQKMFWRPKPNAKDYAALALAVARAFREAGLGEALIGPATSRIDLGFLKTCFKAGLLEHWAAVSVHPYRMWLPPETAGVSYDRLRALLRRQGADGDFPILSSEWGYSSVQFGLDAELQGKFLARMWLFNLASGVPLSIWYDWKNDGSDPKNNEHHFGIVGIDLKPKPAFHAAKTLTESLAGHRFERRLRVGDAKNYVLEFSREGKPRWAAWRSSPKPATVTLPGLTGRFHSVSHDGKVVKRLTAGPKGLQLRLGDAPQYLQALP